MKDEPMTLPEYITRNGMPNFKLEEDAFCGPHYHGVDAYGAEWDIYGQQVEIDSPQGEVTVLTLDDLRWLVLTLDDLRWLVSVMEGMK